MKQTRQAVHNIKQSIYFDVYEHATGRIISINATPPKEAKASTVVTVVCCFCCCFHLINFTNGNIA
jgi:hypothetical protein